MITFDWGEPIYSYSRAQAIEDGELVDLTEWARETGFKYPVAITRAAFEDFIAWPEDLRPEFGQSERGRAHDVLWMLFNAARRANGNRVDFSVSRLRQKGSHLPVVGRLYSLCGPGDTPEPVITIMLPGED